MQYPQENIKPYHQDGKKSEQVERMFNNIAPTYDKLNHILSFGIDKYWRRRALKCLKPFQPQFMMDVATGTGDFAMLACKKLHPKSLIGTDISEGMMEIGKTKAEKKGLSHQLTFAKEDCMQLSFKDNTFDAITSAFGIRNFEDLNQGLSEIYRVLKPGGHMVILELTTPENCIMKQLYTFYSKYFIPACGKLMSKDKSAYQYLPETIKVFPQGEVMQKVIAEIGFKKVMFKRLTIGICTLYFAEK